MALTILANEVQDNLTDTNYSCDLTGDSVLSVARDKVNFVAWDATAVIGYPQVIFNIPGGSTFKFSLDTIAQKTATIVRGQ